MHIQLWTEFARSPAVWSLHVWFALNDGAHFSPLGCVALSGALLAGVPLAFAEPVSTRPDIGIRQILTAPEAGSPIRIVRDSAGGSLFLMMNNGDIHLVTLDPGNDASSRLAYTVADHGVGSPQGMELGPDGALYVLGNERLNARETQATIMVGRRAGGPGGRAWTMFAQSAVYERGGAIFNHLFNGMAVNPDGAFLYASSGARTDHGEIQDTDGAYPGLRESDITTIILRIPTSMSGVILANDEEALRDAEFLFCKGIRNTWDMAFSPDGELFGAENGPDRDMPEELNWLREGHHYGFPWRMGLDDNPQQFAGYDPGGDLLLNPNYNAVQNGYYHDDPTFPPAPAFMTDPVLNLGPHADKFRDSSTGEILDASELGVPFATFTAHRSPLGLAFDSDLAMSPEFRGDGFMLSWTPGNADGEPASGPFHDPSEDLLHLNLFKSGDNYSAYVTRLVQGFDRPVDSAIIGNRIYVLEYGGGRGLWEITMPTETPVADDLHLTGDVNADGHFEVSIEGLQGESGLAQTSHDLEHWVHWQAINVPEPGTPVNLVDDRPATQGQRYYRVLDFRN